MANIKKTPERLAKAETLYAHGEKIDVIALVVGVSRVSILRWARIGGWQRPSVDTMREWRWLNRRQPRA